MTILLPLAITLALETGIYMILKHRDFKLLVVVSLLNIILNPLMNIGLCYITDNTLYWVILSLSEIATVLLEAAVITLIFKMRFTKVLLFAFLANLLSFSVGLILFFTPIYQTKIAAIIVTGLFFSVYLFTYGFTLTSFILNYRHRNDDSRRDE